MYVCYMLLNKYSILNTQYTYGHQKWPKKAREYRFAAIGVLLLFELLCQN